MNQEELLIRARDGDREAGEALIQANSGLVWSVARRFFGRGVDPDDLYQLGCLGFLKAVAGFDLSYGTQFSTYAVPKIAGEIRRYLRDNSAIRVSRSMRDTAYRVLQCREAMQAEQSREPTLEEVARRLELPLETVNTAMDAISAPVSLYDPVYTDGGDPLTVMDQVRDTKNTDEQWVERIALREAISTLGEREKRILALRFFDGRTQMEVASEVGISQAQVSRLEKNAIRTLRKAIC